MAKNHAFPKCLICGMVGNPTVVCLDPTCHEAHLGLTVDPPVSELISRDSHSWKTCALCARPLLADTDAWESYGLCSRCYNQYADKRMVPPSSPMQLRLHMQSGVLFIGSEDMGLTRQQVVRVTRLPNS
jgi:hypothetical protein